MMQMIGILSRQRNNVDRKAKATIPELYPPMSSLANSEAYYLKYSTIMKHLVKAGDNPDMSEEHVVGMMNDILREFAPQIKAMCLSMVGNRPTGKGLNLRMSGMIKFIGLVDDMKATHPTKSDNKLRVMITTELDNMFQRIFKHKLLNGLTDSSTVSTMAKFIRFHVPPVHSPTMTCRAALVGWPAAWIPSIDFTGMKNLMSKVLKGTLENGYSTTLDNLLTSPGELAHELGFFHHDVSPKRTTATTRNKKRLDSEDEQVVLTLTTANSSIATKAMNALVNITQTDGNLDPFPSQFMVDWMSI